MKNYYYEIKARLEEPESNAFGGVSNWQWPPLFFGKVEAIDRKDANKQIEELYSKKIPSRVLKDDLANNPFLLRIEEIKEGSHTARLFEKQKCSVCESSFYVIDKYNDPNQQEKSFEFCSYRCRQDYFTVQSKLRTQFREESGNQNPTIYKITNKHNGYSYIGKTTQPFTLRWYQHFFQHNDCKFHRAIKESKISDWIFEIQEIVIIPSDIKTVDDIDKLVSSRERFWIEENNSINAGYNSI